MGILQKLGLKKKPNATVAGARDQLQDFVKGLPTGHTAGLGLARTTNRVAENLTALKGKGEDNLYALKCGEMAGIANRMATVGAAGPSFAMDAAQLELLAAETTAVRSANKANLAAAEAARGKFADEFAKRFKAGGDLQKSADMAADMAAHVTDLAADEDRDAELQAALRALDLLKQKRTPAPPSGTPPTVPAPPAPINATIDPAIDAAREASRVLASANQAGGQAMPASMAPRGAARTPNDVLVHLMSAVNAANKATPNTDLAKVAADGRAMFVSHTLDLASVKQLVDRAKVALEAAGASGKICDALKGQLPATEEQVTTAQKQENLYGRVFDTRLVSALVADPPDTFKAAMGASAAELEKALPNNNLAENAAFILAKKTVAGDLRSWSGAVPGLKPIATATNGKEALAALRTFLKTPPTTGPEIVAFPFIMAKLSLAMKNCGVAAPWLDAANVNYTTVIQAQAVREAGAVKGEEPVSEGAGITLLHQPTAENNPNLRPSVRPGTVNRFGNREELKTGIPSDSGKGLDEVDRTQSIELAHDRSLPFASGVSGTTNILMHLLKHQKDKGVAIDTKDFLMSSMMFLVYDGGHSIHEVMWTANQLDGKLGLGLGFGDPTKPNEFVSDYGDIGSKLTGNGATAFNKSMDDAWTGTQDYLQQNSYFAQIGAEDEDESEAALSN